MTREQAESLQTFARRNGVMVAVVQPWGTTSYAVMINGSETFYNHDNARRLIEGVIGDQS